MLKGLFRDRAQASTTPGAFKTVHGLETSMPSQPFRFRADAINPVRNPSNGQY